MKVSIKCPLSSDGSRPWAKGEGSCFWFAYLAGFSSLCFLFLFLPKIRGRVGSPWAPFLDPLYLPRVDLRYQSTIDHGSCLEYTRSENSSAEPITPSCWFCCPVVINFPFLFPLPSFFILLTPLSSVLSWARINQHDKYRYSRNGAS